MASGKDFGNRNVQIYSHPIAGTIVSGLREDSGWYVVSDSPRYGEITRGQISREISLAVAFERIQSDLAIELRRTESQLEGIERRRAKIAGALAKSGVSPLEYFESYSVVNQQNMEVKHA